jgi:hypothetical protein
MNGVRAMRLWKSVHSRRGRLFVSVGAVAALLAVGVGWWQLSDVDDDAAVWTRDFTVAEVLVAYRDKALVTTKKDGPARILDLEDGHLTELEIPVHYAVSLDATGGGLGHAENDLVSWDGHGRAVWSWGPFGDNSYVAAITPETVVVKNCEGRYGYDGPATVIGLRRDDGSEVWRGKSLCNEAWTSLPPVVIDFDRQRGRLRMLNADTGAAVTSQPAKQAIWSPGGKVVLHDGNRMWALSPEGRELWRAATPAPPCSDGYAIFGETIFGSYPYVFCEEPIGSRELTTALVDPDSGKLRELDGGAADVRSIVGAGFLGPGKRLAEREEDDATGRWAITLHGTTMVAADWITGKRAWVREMDGFPSCAELTLPANAIWRYGTVILRCDGGTDGEPTAWILDFRTGSMSTHADYDEQWSYFALPDGRALVSRPNGPTDLVGGG